MAIPLLVKWVEQSGEPELPQRIRHIDGAPAGHCVCACCPICDKVEKSIAANGSGRGATAASVARIRDHTKFRHRAAVM